MVRYNFSLHLYLQTLVKYCNITSPEYRKDVLGSWHSAIIFIPKRQLTSASKPARVPYLVFTFFSG
jgi:hypothetical protein